jgi:rhodanese-related sulfurtransferase
MAATVLQAVISRFDSSTAGVLTSSSGKLHLNEVPEDKDLPWCIFIHGNVTVVDYTTETDYHKSHPGSFLVFGSSVEQVETVALEIQKSFHLPASDANAALATDNVRIVWCKENGYTVTLDPDLQKNSEKVYSAQVDIEILARHTLGTS